MKTLPKHTRSIAHYLQKAHIQPFENFSVVKLRVCGSDGCLQDTRQVVLVQSGGGTHQLWPGDKKILERTLLAKIAHEEEEERTEYFSECGCLLEQVHQVSDEVSLAEQQVSPHGLQVLQQQIVAVENVQQVLAGVEVGSVDFLLERPL